MPKRIQRQRSKGWKMPERTIYVGRPTIYGNPFPVDIYGQERAVDLYKRWLASKMSSHELTTLSFFEERSAETTRRTALSGLPALRGKDLACWCAILDAKTGIRVPCHADVLLELANR